MGDVEDQVDSFRKKVLQKLSTQQLDSSHCAESENISEADGLALVPHDSCAMENPAEADMDDVQPTKREAPQRKKHKLKKDGMSASSGLGTRGILAKAKTRRKSRADASQSDNLKLGNIGKPISNSSFWSSYKVVLY